MGRFDDVARRNPELATAQAAVLAHLAFAHYAMFVVEMARELEARPDEPVFAQVVVGKSVVIVTPRSTLRPAWWASISVSNEGNVLRWSTTSIALVEAHEFRPTADVDAIKRQMRAWAKRAFELVAQLPAAEA